MPETSGDAYDRGHIAGGIEARLADHDKHFRNINGSIDNVATQLEQLNMAVQRLADQRKSDNATVLTTASALKDAEAARRDRSEQSWTPFARLAVLISAIVAVLGIALAIYTNAR